MTLISGVGVDDHAEAAAGLYEEGFGVVTLMVHGMTVVVHPPRIEMPGDTVMDVESSTVRWFIQPDPASAR